jgi:hypothetical protein
MEDLFWEGTNITLTGEYHMGFGGRNWGKQLKPIDRDLKKNFRT